MKNIFFAFIFAISMNSFALSADECRSLIDDIHSLDGQEEWKKCLFSDTYVKKSISTKIAGEGGPTAGGVLVEDLKNKVFDLSLGGDVILELKRLSREKKIRIGGASNCVDFRCEISDFFIQDEAYFVFENNIEKLKREKSELIQDDLNKPYKNKGEISDFYKKPSLAEIGVKVVGVEIGENPHDSYQLYIHKNILIGVRPVKDFYSDELPIDKNEMIDILNRKYTKLKSLRDKMDKGKYFATKDAIFRWKINDDVEIRLYSHEAESINYFACVKKNSIIFGDLASKFCLPNKTNVLVYMLRQPFDSFENEIKTKESEKTDALWEKIQKNKNKF